MAAGDKIFLADKPTLDRVDSNIGSRDSGEQTVFERLADLETKETQGEKEHPNDRLHIAGHFLR